MIRVTVSTREEVSAVIAALGAAGLRNLDDYTINAIFTCPASGSGGSEEGGGS